ncbi:hypothetical protein RFI_05231, partial [Reticulomyxa filosa]
ICIYVYICLCGTHKSTKANETKKKQMNGMENMEPITSDVDENESSDNEYQTEENTLHKIACYVDVEVGIEHIFDSFGRGVGSYVLVPNPHNNDSQYCVSLVVHTKRGLQTFAIALVNKKEGVYFRLSSHKSKDFADFNQMIFFLSTKENLLFTYPIPRVHVQDKTGLSTCLSLSTGESAANSSPTGNDGDMLVALFDFKESKERELEFEMGDQIRLIRKDNSGWWLGKLDKTGDIGWFPSEFTAPITVPTSNRNCASFTSEIHSCVSQQASYSSSSSTSNTAPSLTLASHSSRPSDRNPNRDLKIFKSIESNLLSPSSDPRHGASTFIDRNYYVISYHDLKNKNFDETIDKQHLELRYFEYNRQMYLSDLEFQELFQCSRREFSALPVWRQKQRKKALELF